MAICRLITDVLNWKFPGRRIEDESLFNLKRILRDHKKERDGIRTELTNYYEQFPELITQKAAASTARKMLKRRITPGILLVIVFVFEWFCDVLLSRNYEYCKKMLLRMHRHLLRELKKCRFRTRHKQFSLFEIFYLF